MHTPAELSMLQVSFQSTLEVLQKEKLIVLPTVEYDQAACCNTILEVLKNI